jgi:aminopeptidase N
MKKIFVGLSLILGMHFLARAQEWKNMYRESSEKQLSMVHTKLEVSFDYTNSRMAGKAWLTMTPHFYPTDMAILDAKGMLIHEVALMAGNQRKKLEYTYEDSMVLKIKLDRRYKKGEKPVLYIDYTARPNDLKQKGSSAIQSAKGLYFINPDGKDSTKPTQIWTQGETEATSVWCPTVDRPNQKTTQEISMRVPDKFVTLSNGLLVKQVKNNDGTRTDYWKMDLPHAPYLMFMGVGDYAVIKDKYKNISVDYYVEKEYAGVAKRIFGSTVEMLDFFTKLLGVEYPWPKYAQMTAQDYVSGAMENTTATLHGPWSQQNARELTDGNSWEPVVAHELFHHWFGDLVTAESWSNLTVNESFADYSEYLWTEYKNGRDEADAYHYQAMMGYLSNPTEQTKHLVRFYYRDKEDMFDQVSYQKGGRILHMLRYHLGDSAFYRGLELYLKQNQFKAAEAHNLRLALEEVSGRDLNPFFNQWFFNNGHPEVDIHYGSSNGRDFIAFEQKQKDYVFDLPLKIAAYSGTEKPILYDFRLKQRVDTFFIKNNEGAKRYYEADADRVMLWKKTETKTPEQWQAQFNRKGNFISRYEALTQHEKLDTLGESTRQMMLMALKDPAKRIRSKALSYFTSYPAQLKTDTEWSSIEKIARADEDRTIRASAIGVLSKKAPNPYAGLYKQAIYDSSYSVAGAALEALMEHDIDAAISASPKLKEDARGRLESALNILEIAAGDVNDPDGVIAAFKKLPGLSRIFGVKGMLFYANKLQDPVGFKNTVGAVMDLYRRIPASIGTYKADMLSDLKGLMGKKEAALAKDPNNANLKEQVSWLQEQLK